MVGQPICYCYQSCYAQYDVLLYCLTATHVCMISQWLMSLPLLSHAYLAVSLKHYWRIRNLNTHSAMWRRWVVYRVIRLKWNVCYLEFRSVRVRVRLKGQLHICIHCGVDWWQYCFLPHYQYQWVLVTRLNLLLNWLVCKFSMTLNWVQWRIRSEQMVWCTSIFISELPDNSFICSHSIASEELC